MKLRKHIQPCVFKIQHHKPFSVGLGETAGLSDVSGRGTSRLMCPTCDCRHNNIKDASVLQKPQRIPEGEQDVLVVP